MIAISLGVSVANGQLREGAWGIKANLLGSFSNLGIAYCRQPDIRLGVDLGFSSSQKGVDSSSRFFVGITPWCYLGSSENVSAFAGGLIGLSSLSNGGSQSGFTLEGHFGAEYWFSQKFSWNGYMAVDLTSYSGGNGSQFGTFTSTGLTRFLEER